MIASSPCPGQLNLQQFLLGQCSDADGEVLEEHLEHCSACMQQLSSMHPGDAVVDSLRHATPLPGDLQVSNLIDRLKALHLPAAAHTRDRGDGPTPADGADQPGLPRVIGRYRVVELIGQGGMGTVYRGHDPELDRVVAIKVPRYPMPLDNALRARFLREARAAARVRHVNVCPVYDVGEYQGWSYVVMAYIDGRSLADQLVEGRPLECGRAVQLAAQVARALEAVHAHGIIHRDLKPGNILIDPSGQALVSDFGLARPENDTEQLSADGALIGTPAYMAPEQAVGKPALVGRWSDLYSLGVVLYQMLTGRLPFEAESARALLDKSMHEKPAPPSQFRPNLDPAVEAIVLKAMAARVEDRFQSARDMAEALERWLAGQPVNVSVPSWSAPTVALRRAPSGSRRRRGWLPAALVAAGLFLAAVTYGLLFSGRTSVPTSAPENAATTPPTAVLFRGSLTAFVYDPDKRERQRLDLNAPGALPLRAGDGVRVEAKLNRPGYLYLVWIDNEGKAAPVYPWRPGRWDERPAQEQPRQLLELPEDMDGMGGWEIKAGPSGMETILMLVRDTPLPRDVDLGAHFQGLSAARFQLKGAIWFENGAVVRADIERERGPNFLATRRVEDPVLQTQQLLRGRLKSVCDYSLAVSFTTQGN
jgi:serine/threonine protein kinase